jgi:DNA polymerase-3 subunit gamma/tau
MSYQVLALKWRPQVFDDVIGQVAVTRTLKNAIKQGRIANAFLFSGVRGVGKTTTARILAKALNCSSSDDPTTEPCGECPSCKEIAASRSLDVLEIDGASHTKVEEIRDVLEASQYAPSRDRFKIYVIDEVHMLSMHSFNALLKTLEEPPPHLKFIFATTEYHKIPDTIVSRCQQFEFRTVPGKDIARHLRRISDAEGVTISDSALGQITRAAEGSIRDALSALDQVVAATGSAINEADVTDLLGLIAGDVLSRTTRAIVERDTAEILSIVDHLISSGRDLQSFSRGLLQFFRDVLVVRITPDSPELVEMAGDRDELTSLAEQVSEEDLIRCLEILTQLEGALRWAPEPRFHLEVALLKLAEMRRLASFEDLLARFEALESGRSPAGFGGGGPTNETVSRRPKAAPSKGSPTKPVRKSSATTASRRDTSEEPLTPTKPGGVSDQPSTTAATPGEIVDQVLERLRSAKPKLAALVSHHNGASLEGDCLRLNFVVDQPFLREQIQEEEFRKLLEKEASQVAGRPLRIEVRFADFEKKEEEPARKEEAPGKQTDLLERAMKDPMVRGFVETFQGEVEEVRPLDSSNKTESDRLKG